MYVKTNKIYTPYRPGPKWDSGLLLVELSNRRFCHQEMFLGWTCHAVTDYDVLNSNKILKQTEMGHFTLEGYVNWNSDGFAHYLPTRFGDVSEVRKMIFDPVVNFLQCHVSVILAVDSKLDHSHVGVWRSLRLRVLLFFWTLGLLKRKTTIFWWNVIQKKEGN